MWTSSRSEKVGGGSGNKNKTSDKIVVGYVASAHGVRGGIRIVPLTDFPDRFFRMKSLELYAEGARLCTLRVTRARAGSKGRVIVESDLLDRSEAERLVGASVLIDPEERVPLPEGSFWVDDLIGLAVHDSAGNILGVVKDLLSSGGNEIYEVKDVEGRLRYIPAVGEFVKNIDLAEGRIVVELMKGLWE
ncbi:MAG: ribosome maturation factor RimM [Synergistaceae bacterium]|jgi:16S rRNA processing protein RimM|nr:ribosome maturation factor RimM [Synergistaceae bacterium]